MDNKSFITDFFDIDEEILILFTKDMSSKKNIIWATDNYKKHGSSYSEKSPISVNLLKINRRWIIEPRVYKSKIEQKKRSKDKAEVFTPSWVCNKQNNLVDDEYFGYSGSFNIEDENHTWISTSKVNFKNKNWEEYISLDRLEITCGEAPYLVSRYDTVNGNYIEVKDRIGLLDRKLRVINENVDSKEDWFKYALIAVQSIYGFDFQGDNVLISRINLLKDVCDFYKDKFNEKLSKEEQLQFAKIIVWNIWQMDGLKYVVPFSCHYIDIKPITLFEENYIPKFCEGCTTGNNNKHNGIYSKIKDWKKNKTVKFKDLVGGYS